MQLRHIFLWVAPCLALNDTTYLKTLSRQIREKQASWTKAAAVSFAAYYAKHTAVSYCSDASLQAWSCRQCQGLGRGVRLDSVIVGKAYDTRATLLIDFRQGTLVLSFRGTDSFRNWMTNLQYDKTPFLQGNVHRGFSDAANDILPSAVTKLRALLNSPRYARYSLMVTGHSSGGALAMLVLPTLQRQLKLTWGRISLYTYNQPRVGDLAFVNWYNQLPIRSTRVVNENDLFPHLPPTYDNYLHHHQELFISNGTPVYCSTRVHEDESCSNSRAPFLDMTPHNSALGVHFGTDQCS